MVRAADVDIHIGADTKDAERGFTRVDGLMSSIGGNLIGGVAQEWFIGLTNNVVGMASSFLMANANAETMMNSLTIATGSAEKAATVYSQIQTMAAQSPFEFPELMESAVALEALGVSSMDYLETIGNASAGTGKTINQTTQAFLDAQMGEFERLKEFGIQAVDENGKTYLQYMQNGQMVRKEVDRNNQAMIASTVEAIWNERYAGAMETQSKTFLGMWSTLKDNWNLTMQALSKPLFEFAKKGLKAGVEFFEDYSGMIKNGASVTRALEVAINNFLLNFFSPKQTAAIMAGIRSTANAFKTFFNVVKAVASFVGGVLGKVFGTLGKNLNLVAGAAKGIGLLIAIFLGFATVTAILAGVGAALALLLSPLGLILIAAAALGMAWNTNFLGMRDAVTSMVDNVTGRFNDLLDVWNRLRGEGMDPFHAGLTALTAAFPELQGVVSDLSPMLENLYGTWTHLTEAYEHFRDRGLNPVQAGLRALGIMFPSLAGVTGDLQIVVGHLTEAFASLLEGDFSGFFSSIGNAAQGAWDIIQGLAGSLLEWTLDTAVPEVTGWLKDAVGDAWGALKRAAGWSGNVIGEMGSWFLNTVPPKVLGWLFTLGVNAWNAIKLAAGYAGNIIGEMGSWFLNTVPPTVLGWLFVLATNAWTAIKLAAGYSGNVIGEMGAWSLDTIPPTVTGWFEDIQGWAEGLFDSVNWSAVGTVLREKALAAFTGAFKGGLKIGNVFGEVVPQILDSLTSAIENVSWDSLGESVGRMIVEAIIVTFSGVGSLMALGPIFIAGILSGLVTADWASIATSIGDYIIAALGAWNNFTSGLVTGMGAAFTDAVGQISWASVASAISAKLSNAIGTVKDFASRIVPKMTQEFLQAVRGIDWGTIGTRISTYLSEAIGKVKDFAGKLRDRLKNEFIEAVRGVDFGAVGSIIRDRLIEAIGKVKDFAKGLQDRLRNEFSEAVTGIDLSGVASTIKTKLIEAVKGIGKAVWDTIWGEFILNSSGDRDDTPRVPPGDVIDVEGDKTIRATIDALTGLQFSYGATANAARAATPALKDFWAAVSGGDGGRGAGGSGGGSGPTGALEAINSSMLKISSTATQTAQTLRVAGMEGGLAFSSGIAGGISAGTSTITGAISAITAAAATAAALMRVSGMTGGLAFSSGTAGGISAGTSIVTGAVNRLVSILTNAQGQFRVAGMTSGMAGGSGVAGGLSAQSGTVSGAVNRLVAILSNSSGAFRVAGMTVGLAGGSGVAGGISASSGSVGGAIGRLVGIAAGYAGAMRGIGNAIGSALGSGIAAGIISQVGAVAAAVSALVAAANIGGIKAAQAHSPSRLTMNSIGVPMGQGVAVGIGKNESFVVSTMKDLVWAAGHVSPITPYAPTVTVGVQPPVQGGLSPILYGTGGRTVGATQQPIQYIDQRQYNVTLDVDDLEELNETKDFFDRMESSRQQTFGR